MYRAHGPEAFAPSGEVEFANGVRDERERRLRPRAICAGIVSHVNLLLGEGARPVLEAEITGRPGALPRHPALLGWDAEPGRRHVCHAAERPAARSDIPQGIFLSHAAGLSSTRGCFIADP